MDRTLLCRIGFVALAVAGCAQQGVEETGVGGANGSGTGGMVVGAGGAGVGGMGTGGTPTTGAGGNGTGGAPGAGGSNVGVGGAPGMGGSLTGTGGRGTGGMAAGTGGAPGTGGGALDINTIVPGLDGFYWEVTPSGNTALSGTNYPFGSPGGGCPTAASWDTTGYINTRPAFNVKGTTGQKYTINVNVRGVVGTRCYTGGTPGSTAMGVGTGRTTPGTPEGAVQRQHLEHHGDSRRAEGHRTANQANTGYDIYFANSFQNNSNWCQKEATYEARYNASFPVMGGGTITPSFTIRTAGRWRTAGPSRISRAATRTLRASSTCPGSTRRPTNFTQPRTAALGGSTYYVQWVWIDVTSMTSP